MKELGLFALERVADELKRPPHKEKRKRIKPQPVNEDAPDEQCQGDENRRYAKRMADPVYRVLMAVGILRDPLFGRAIAQHGELMIHGLCRKVACGFPG